MPATLTYPGVYIEEVPSGVRTIVGVATSITAFVGRAPRGPVDEPITLNGFGDFERIFGGLWTESRLGYAVRDFYLNGGSQAIVVRLYHPRFADETARQAALAAATTSAQTGANAVKTAADAAAAAAGATPQSVADAATAAANGVAAGPGKVAANTVAGAATTAAPAAGATPATVATAATNAVAAAVSAAANAEAPVSKAGLSVNGLTLQAAYEGKWGNSLRARVDHEVADQAATALGVNKSDLFNLRVKDTKTGQIEEFRNVTVKDSARRIDSVLTSESRLVRASGALPGSIPTKHGDPAAGKDVFEDDTASSKVSTEAGDGKDLDANAFIGTGKEAAKEGLYALKKTDLFNLLCIPPHKVDGDVDGTVVSAAAKLCEDRRAMIVLDSPLAWNDKDKAKAGISGFPTTSKNAALFFPRLRQPDPLKEQQIDTFAACGAVAGVFARTDTQRGVWKAPAGLEAVLNNVPALSVNLTNEENGELNPLGINCLRIMPPAGRIVWGSRTLQGDDRFASEWKYIPVRRTALFIEESLFRGTHWVVFEPNDEPLWAQIRLNVGAFMQGLFRQGAFQGATPREAYFVKCDSQTTTQDDINRGVVNIHVGFAPLKPAEFVVIKLQQMAGQIQA